MGKVLNYGRAFYYAKDSTTTNKLFIEVDSRTRVGEEEYLLLAPHPREQTFMDDGNIYSHMLSLASGASFITFLVDQTHNKSVISRRYDVPGQPESDKQALGPAPYDGPLHNPPVEVDADELFDTADILAAADANKKMVAVVEYTMYTVPVRIEFPVRVMNINPDPNAPVGKQWQIASPTVGVVVQTTNYQNRLKPGYVAFGRIGPGVTVSMVYLNNVSTPRVSQDYSTAVNVAASVMLFAMP